MIFRLRRIGMPKSRWTTGPSSVTRRKTSSSGRCRSDPKRRRLNKPCPTWNSSQKMKASSSWTHSPCRLDPSQHPSTSLSSPSPKATTRRYLFLYAGWDSWVPERLLFRIDTLTKCSVKPLFIPNTQPKCCATITSSHQAAAITKCKELRWVCGCQIPNGDIKSDHLKVKMKSPTSLFLIF